MTIKELKKEDCQNMVFDCHYLTKSYIDVVIKQKRETIRFELKKKRFKRKQKRGFETTLFEEYIKNPEVFGIYDKSKLIGVIQGSLEDWNQCYRVWDFWIDPRYRREGLGMQLFNHLLEKAKNHRARAVILEVQSCNEPAISFYKKMGFNVIGLNTICYSNEDIANHEVRLEMAIRLI